MNHPAVRATIAIVAVILALAFRVFAPCQWWFDAAPFGVPPARCVEQKR